MKLISRTLLHFHIDRWRTAGGRVESLDDVVAVITNLKYCLLQHRKVCEAGTVGVNISTSPHSFQSYHCHQ